MQNTGRKREKIAKMRASEPWALRVYHICINHDRYLRETKDLLKRMGFQTPPWNAAMEA